MDLEARDAALRADIRRLGNQLGDSLVRQEGSELLDLVEEVRAITRRLRHSAVPQDDELLEELLAGLDLETLSTLARAFTAYFYLANVAEQTHRLDELAARTQRERGWMESTVDQIETAGLERSEVEPVLERLELRPVFTAHPTEASRRSILTKLNAVADLLDDRLDTRATDADRRRIDRRLAELIDELTLIHRSLLENKGGLVASGMVARATRTAAAFGFHLATMDVRQVATKHHDALCELFDRLGAPYDDLDARRRAALLSDELAGMCKR